MEMFTFRTSTVLLAILLLLFATCTSSESLDTPTENTATPGNTIEPIALQVELAGEVWGEKFLKGLSGRASLEGGMLFDFGETVTVPFQTRDTLIALSAAFISEDYVLVDILDMEPLSEKSYESAKPYRYALEVNQKYFELNCINVGDRVEFLNAGSPDHAIVHFFKTSQ